MLRFKKWFDDLPPQATVQIALQKLWGERYRAVAHYLKLLQTEKTPSVETVHQLRVWARRTAAVVDLFGPPQPVRPWMTLRKQLKKIRRIAGETRDYDVLWEQLRQSKEVDEDFKSTWKRRRRAARKRLSEAARTKKVLKDGPQLLQESAREIRALPDRSRKLPFRNLARQHLKLTVRNWLKQSGTDLTKPDEMHQFRIEGKRLRYALENVASVLPLDHVKQLYAKLNTLHTLLGEICDTRAAIERYELLREEVSSSLRKTLAGILRQERRRLKSQQRKFLKHWNAAARKAWAAEFKKLLA